MIQKDKKFLILLVVHPQSDPPRGKVQFSHNLIVNFFEKAKCKCKQEYLEIRIRKQILDHYLRDIFNINSYYGIFTFEKLPSQTDTNEWHRSRLLKIFLQNISKISSIEIHKEQIQYSQMKFSLLLIVIYPYYSQKNFLMNHHLIHLDMQL